MDSEKKANFKRPFLPMKSAFFLYIFDKYGCYDIGTANEPEHLRTG